MVILQNVFFLHPTARTLNIISISISAMTAHRNDSIVKVRKANVNSRSVTEGLFHKKIVLSQVLGQSETNLKR